MKQGPIKSVITDKISGEWGDEALDSQGVVVIRTANFVNSGQINFSNLVRCVIDQKKIEKKRLISGDIIIEKSGGSPIQPVGRVVIFQSPDNDTYLCNNFTSILRPNKNKVHPEYLFYVLHDNHKKGRTLRHQNKTTGIINLKLDSYLGSEIPLPPLNDQIRIAHLLCKVERLIAQRKQHLQQLEDLLKSVFLEMFGDPILNPRGFPVRRLSEFYIHPKEGTKCGPFGSALKKHELVESGVPVWNMDNIGPDGQMVMPFRMWITPDKYNELSAYSAQDGDIIISRAGTVGKMCVVRTNGHPSIISTNLIRLRLGPELRPLHFVSLMLYGKGRVGRLKTGADGAFTHMNTGVLDSLEFPYPPVELQDLFAAIGGKVESTKTLYQKSLTDLEVLYGALSQQAFKGELDLSRVPLPAERAPKSRDNQPAQTERFSLSEQAITPSEVINHLQQVAQTTTEGRSELLARWLSQYLTNTSSDASLGSAQFLESAWQLIQAAQCESDGETPALTLDDYDALKDLIFEKLGDGDLVQIFDTDNNRVALQKQHTDFGTW